MKLNSRYWRTIIALTLPVLLGIGPCSSGPDWLERLPGGVLEGPVESEPVADWSFVSEAGLCQVEVRPQFPHSITLNCFNDGPDLYVGCSRCEGKTWSDYATQDPRARIRIGDLVYPVHLTRVTGQAEMLGPWTNRMRKLRGEDAEVPSIPSHYWLYRLTSQTGSQQ